MDMKKYIVSMLAVSVMLMGITFVPKNALASDLSIRDLIKILIIIGVIPQDKISTVNAFLASVDSNSSNADNEITPPVSHLPVVKINPPAYQFDFSLNSGVSLEQKLRGPATHTQAEKDCKADGMRLPTWEEAISDKLNPSQFLTEHNNNEKRIWTNVYCNYIGNDAYATSWSGIPNIVKSGKDTNSYYYQNNCTDNDYKESYQCVVGDNGVPAESHKIFSLDSVFWQDSGDVPEDGNSVNNQDSNIYYNPRLVLEGKEKVPYNNTASATEWCKNVKGEDYTHGVSKINFVNPTNDYRYSFDGDNWLEHSSGDYPRVYVCS